MCPRSPSAVPPMHSSSTSFAKLPSAGKGSDTPGHAVGFGTLCAEVGVQSVDEHPDVPWYTFQLVLALEVGASLAASCAANCTPLTLKGEFEVTIGARSSNSFIAARILVASAVPDRVPMVVVPPAANWP